AEIVAATPDGETLIFSNSGDQEVGFLDIRDPENPVNLGAIDVSDWGEPTAVAVTPNGRYALATVLDLTEAISDQQPGILVFIDLQTQTIAGTVELGGIGPDNLSVTPDGSKAIIAIEDEESEDNLPGQRPGSIDFVTLDYENPSNSTVNNIALDLSDVDGVNYPTDPQPEYVSVSPDGRVVAVSLQENNAIAVLDVAQETVLNIFSTGVSRHEMADLTEDGDIRLTEPFVGRREADSISITPDGQYIITANEGDTDRDRFGDNIWSGGRGWSIFDLEGNVIYDSESELEQQAILHGQYPDDRSENRGIEVEGATSAQFGDQTMAFVASERGSFLAAYNINDPSNPELISFLPTGLAPEGVLALPDRNLLITSNEDDGTIDFFRADSRDLTGYTPQEPLVNSKSLNLPFGALSGLTALSGNPNRLYAVPDNAFSPSRIFTLDLQGTEAVVIQATPITRNGQPMAYDLEGIAENPQGGFWLVSEGDGEDSPNLLLSVNNNGVVSQTIPLPNAAANSITRYGFEGVTTNETGDKVYVAIQREFVGETAARIAEYDTQTKTWNYYFYPLDTDNVDGWVGLSDIARDIDGSFVVLERDNQGGANGAENVQVKRIYRFTLEDVQPGEMVSKTLVTEVASNHNQIDKTLVTDLVEDYDWYAEKVEGLAVTEDGYWVVSDNDGGYQATRLLFVERPAMPPIRGLW
ncbi:MAG: alkaline phosphatase, partial [Kamptonema sp. SIO4C4]|nr:alkaline phosphatase [Kamptonema sp. SIO4C4]